MGSENEDLCWGAPATRVLHPARVWIVESIRRAGQPLSALDLADAYCGRPASSRIAHHLRHLQRLGVIAPVGSTRLDPAPLHRYRLADDDT